MHLWMVSCNRNIRWKHRISVWRRFESECGVEFLLEIQSGLVERQRMWSASYINLVVL